MSRLGKIARLPRAVRDSLNCRLHEGEPGPELVTWLNALPAVQTVLAAHFAGHPINAQNLTDWRQGGYADWCRQQQILELAERLGEEKDELDEATGGELAGWLAQASALALAVELRATRGMAEGPQKLRAVLATVRALDRLQRADLETGRTKRKQRADDPQVRPAATAPAPRRGESKSKRRPSPSPTPAAPASTSSRPAATPLSLLPRPVAPLPFPARAASAPTLSRAASSQPGQFVYPWMNGAEAGFRALETMYAVRAA